MKNDFQFKSEDKENNIFDSFFNSFKYFSLIKTKKIVFDLEKDHAKKNI